jgi:hypothetical protein
MIKKHLWAEDYKNIKKVMKKDEIIKREKDCIDDILEDKESSEKILITIRRLLKFCDNIENHIRPDSPKRLKSYALKEMIIAIILVAIFFYWLLTFNNFYVVLVLLLVAIFIFTNIWLKD